jgi:predicted nucleic acid-binding protein
MLVISDTSPLIVLANTGFLEILPSLFGKILIPPAVAMELRTAPKLDAARDLVDSLPNWLEIRRPKFILSISKLHAGETEALSLAMELHADLFLVDERRGYREAISRNVNAVGTIAIMERAARQGLLQLDAAFDRIKRSDFWISHELLDARLAKYETERS